MSERKYDEIDVCRLRYGGPAFPSGDGGFGGGPNHAYGMDIRDFFAAHALMGLLASGPHDCDQHGLAHDAYLHADAMLKAREGSDQ